MDNPIRFKDYGFPDSPSEDYMEVSLKRIRGTIWFEIFNESEYHPCSVELPKHDVLKLIEELQRMVSDERPAWENTKQ